MKLRIKKSTAFTIVEALVCFMLMGLIFVATITNLKKSDNYTALYWRAFDTLLQAVGNSAAEWNPTCECGSNGEVIGCGGGGCMCWSKNCWNITWNGVRIETTHVGGSVHTREYPGFLYGAQDVGDYNGLGTDVAFCKLLTQKINTLFPDGECRSFIARANDNYKNEGMEFFDAFCIGEGEDAKCMTDNIEPSFIAANGQKFYISPVVTANSMHNVAGKESKRLSYRFVVVDINGGSPPNSQFKKGFKNPDLVLFAITSGGSVIPLGLPEYSKSYINAVVYYPEYLNKPDPKDPTKFLKNTVKTSKSDSLWQAKKSAWGPAKGAPLGSLYGQGFSWNEPLSFSVLFYYNAYNCAGSSCNSSDLSSIYADDLYSQLIMQFMYTELGSKEVFKELTNSLDIGYDKEYGCTTHDSACKIEFLHDK